ncbi:MAG: Zn-ribbon domain-containing protein [Methanosarcinaceae archaeon]
MPHKCTRCENVFEDGAAVILNGCPNCGWNKFLYVSSTELGPQSDDAKSQDAGDTGVIDESKESKLDAASSEDTPGEKFIQEIDDILGIDHKEQNVVEDDEERVESIRILGPGSYELNLDSLLERKEIIMAIKHNGTYAVDLPSVFKKDKNIKNK